MCKLYYHKPHPPHGEASPHARPVLVTRCGERRRWPLVRRRQGKQISFFTESSQEHPLISSYMELHLPTCPAFLAEIALESVKLINNSLAAGSAFRCFFPIWIIWPLLSTHSLYLHINETDRLLASYCFESFHSKGLAFIISNLSYLPWSKLNSLLFSYILLPFFPSPTLLNIRPSYLAGSEELSTTVSV